MEKIIVQIEQEMLNFLDNKEMEELHKVLIKNLGDLSITKDPNEKKYLEDE